MYTLYSERYNVIANYDAQEFCDNSRNSLIPRHKKNLSYFQCLNPYSKNEYLN